MKPAYHRLPRQTFSGTADPSAPRADAYRPTSGLMLTLLCAGLYDSVETIELFESLFPYLSGPQQTDAYVVIELHRLRERIPYKQMEFAHQGCGLSDEERQIGLLKVLKNYCDASSRDELQRIIDILLRYYSTQYDTAAYGSPAPEYEPPEEAYVWADDAHCEDVAHTPYTEQYEDSAHTPYTEQYKDAAHTPYSAQAQEPSEAFSYEAPPSAAGSSADGGMDMNSMLSMMNMLNMMQGGAQGGGGGMDPAQLMNMMGMLQGGAKGGMPGSGGGMDPAQLMNMMGMLQGGAKDGAQGRGGGMDPAQLMNMMGMLQGGAKGGMPSSGGGMDPAQLMNMMGMLQGGAKGGMPSSSGGMGNMLQLMQMFNKK
ncbi:MAG: hypothetical protein ACOYJC_00445 [Christensenellales bacterium]